MEGPGFQVHVLRNGARLMYPYVFSILFICEIVQSADNSVQKLLPSDNDEMIILRNRMERVTWNNRSARSLGTSSAHLCWASPPPSFSLYSD